MKKPPADFQPVRPGERMLTVEEAQQQTMEAVRLLGCERVTISAALGRVLRENIYATHDVPLADNTAMDGYAVQAADLETASQEKPVALRVLEDVPAGSVGVFVVERGTASRIMTGAPIPAGADTVVPMELTDSGFENVSVFRGMKKGANIRRRGEDMRAGQRVLETGIPLGAGEIGVLAGAQKSVVTVGRRPAVAILSTGDELVDIDEPLSAGKVVNSNSYSLAALVEEAGAIPRMVGIAADQKQLTMQAIETALESDMIVSTGGVSVGAYDFVKDALDALGAKTKFWQVAMKPGRPIVLSEIGDRLYFGLPGNPVSCMVSFLLFIAPAIRKAMGQKERLFPATVNARLEGSLRSRGDRRSYQRVQVIARDGQLVAIPMSRQGSGVSTSMIAANGFAIMDTGVTELAGGATVPVALFGKVYS